MYISLEIDPKTVARRLNLVLEKQMRKFQSHDGDPTSVYFSDLVELELKTRGGQTYYGVTQPWLVLGWEHTGSPRDIMEFRVVRGAITKPKDPDANG